MISELDMKLLLKLKELKEQNFLIKEDCIALMLIVTKCGQQEKMLKFLNQTTSFDISDLIEEAVRLDIEINGAKEYVMEE